MKFKPGLSANFVTRYVQISKRAVRYFKDNLASFSENPIVTFKKNQIRAVAPIKINKESYVKKGSKIAQSKQEDILFDNAFEIELVEQYEDIICNKHMEIEHACQLAKEARAREK